MHEPTLADRLAACERAHRRLLRLVCVQCIAAAVLVVACTTAAPRTPASLRVTELVIVDPAGVERVRIGGDLPDAVIGGNRVPRGEKAAGVLLYDGTGQERGGYVTFEPSGNVGLTLDTRKGQVALLAAGPDGGAVVQIWHRNDAVELRSDSDGSRVTAVKGGEVVFQQPALGAMSAETCAAYREARGRVSEEQVRRDCRRRFAEEPCRACLE